MLRNLLRSLTDEKDAVRAEALANLEATRKTAAACDRALASCSARARAFRLLH